MLSLLGRQPAGGRGQRILEDRIHFRRPDQAGRYLGFREHTLHRGTDDRLWLSFVGPLAP
ncbi:MAG: hypothetical protein M5T61_18545 [Acidimicrobiia bacterium]|nr:hypothetical protein [Acidimicrobiia bacterium]